MAIRYVRSGGDTGAWTGTYASVTLALSGITNADTIYVAPDHNHNAGAAITWTLPTSPGLRILGANSTASAPPTGTSTTAQEAVGAASAAFAVTGFAYIYGLKIVGGTNNSASCVVNIGTAPTAQGIVLEDCALTVSTANAGGAVQIGATAGSSDDDIDIRLVRPTITFSASGQTIKPQNGKIRARGVVLAGTAPTTLVTFVLSTYPDVRIECSDLSGIAWSNLAAIAAAGGGRLVVDRCKMPASFAATTGAWAGIGGPEVYVQDCANGDTHGTFQYHNALGSLLTDSGIYFTAGPSTYSWKITTTALANYAHPFVAPIIGVYHSGTSAITPYAEILRDGSSTAYQNDEIWVEVCAKVTASSTRATISSGRMALLGTPANITTGAGAGSWTGENATAWFGKLDGAGSVTPAEAGDLSLTVFVGEPSITVYVDPVIRT